MSSKPRIHRMSMDVGDDVLYAGLVRRAPNEAADKEETVVFCHGVGGNHASWFQQVAFFASHLPVLTWDQRGFGNSSNQAGLASPAQAVADLRTIVKRVGLGRVHLVGQSMGGTSLRAIDEIAQVVSGAREHGLSVSTEAYPYGAGMTGILVPFLHPDNLPRLGNEPRNIVVVATGERPAHAARLLEIREQDPGAMVIIHYLDEANPDDWAVVQRALLLEDTAIASDAVPFTLPNGELVEDTWPLPPEAISHPRSTGTFARVMGTLVRDLQVISLLEAVGRCTLVPSRVVEDVAPVMRRKARVQAGADADLVVFDPECIADQSTYGEPTHGSVGVEHLLVNGEFVVRDQLLLTSAMPGRPVRGETA